MKQKTQTARTANGFIYNAVYIGQSLLENNNLITLTIEAIEKN